MNHTTPPEPSPAQIDQWWAEALDMHVGNPRPAFMQLARLAHAAGWEARGAVKESLTAEAPPDGHLRDATKMAQPPAEGEAGEAGEPVAVAGEPSDEELLKIKDGAYCPSIDEVNDEDDSSWQYTSDYIRWLDEDGTPQEQEAYAAKGLRAVFEAGRRWDRPAPPAEGEVGELVRLLRNWADHYCEAMVDEQTADRFARAADLLERQAASPVPPPAEGEAAGGKAQESFMQTSQLTLGVTDLLPPGDDEIKAWADSCDCVPPEILVDEDDWDDGYGLIFRPAQFYETVRAALARWGSPVPAVDPIRAVLEDSPEGKANVGSEIWSEAVANSDSDDECRSFQRGAEWALTRWGSPVQPPAAGEARALVAWLRRHVSAQEAAGTHWAGQLARAADLLERQAAPVPVASDVCFEFVVSDADYCTQAGGSAPTYAQALSEGQNYLAQFQQDGPHTLELRRVEVLPLPSGEELA